MILQPSDIASLCTKANSFTARPGLTVIRSEGKTLRIQVIEPIEHWVLAEPPHKPGERS